MIKTEYGYIIFIEVHNYTKRIKEKLDEVLF